MKIKFLKILTCILLVSFTFIPEVYAADTSSITVTVTLAKQIAGVSIRLSPRNRRARPGQIANLRATVRNEGDGYDYFELTAASSLGWKVEFPKGDTAGPIRPGRRERIPVRVIIPSDAKRGDRDTVTITATSQLDSSVSDSSFSTIIAR